MRKKAQAALDYLVIVGLLMVVVLPLFFWAVSGIDRTRSSQLDDALETVKSAVKVLTELGQFSATRVVLYLPKGIETANITNASLIVDFGTQQIVKYLAFPIQGIFPIAAGRHFVNLKHMGSYIQFYQCGNQVVEGPEQCENNTQCPSGTCYPPGSQYECYCYCSDSTQCPGGTLCINEVCLPQPCQFSFQCSKGQYCCLASGTCQSCTDKDRDKFNLTIPPQCNAAECGTQFDCFDDESYIPLGLLNASNPGASLNGASCWGNFTLAGGTANNPAGINIMQFAACRNPDPLTNPGSMIREVCDTVDNDCDSLTDEGFEMDGDNMYTCPQYTCVAQGYQVLAGGSEAGFDCDDSNPLINGCVEFCADGINNDCDFQTDEIPCISNCTMMGGNWSKTKAYHGEWVGWTLNGLNCDGIPIQLDIWELDDVTPDDFIGSYNFTFTGAQSHTGSYQAFYKDDCDDGGTCIPGIPTGEPEYYFIARDLLSGYTNTSNNLLTVKPCQDNDKDGYNWTDPSITTNPAVSTLCGPQDCDDVTLDDPVGITCPTNPSGCSKAAGTGACAFCINPGAQDFCGDGIDQDCNGNDLSCSGGQTEFCGNGQCKGTEDCVNCPQDCGVCGPSCGDSVCDEIGGETCVNCPQDCGQCCGDGTCDVAGGENCNNCLSDCPWLTCNNGCCEAIEFLDPGCSDCYCGDGICEGWLGDESCGSCPQDCGICGTPKADLPDWVGILQGFSDTGDVVLAEYVGAGGNCGNITSPTSYMCTRVFSPSSSVTPPYFLDIDGGLGTNDPQMAFKGVLSYYVSIATTLATSATGCPCTTNTAGCPAVPSGWDCYLHSARYYYYPINGPTCDNLPPCQKSIGEKCVQGGTCTPCNAFPPCPFPAVCGDNVCSYTIAGGDECSLCPSDCNQLQCPPGGGPKTANALDADLFVDNSNAAHFVGYFKDTYQPGPNHNMIAYTYYAGGSPDWAISTEPHQETFSGLDCSPINTASGEYTLDSNLEPAIAKDSTNKARIMSYIVSPQSPPNQNWTNVYERYSICTPSQTPNTVALSTLASHGAFKWPNIVFRNGYAHIFITDGASIKHIKATESYINGMAGAPSPIITTIFIPNFGGGIPVASFTVDVDNFVYAAILARHSSGGNGLYFYTDNSTFISTWIETANVPPPDATNLRGRHASIQLDADRIPAITYVKKIGANPGKIWWAGLNLDNTGNCPLTTTFSCGELISKVDWGFGQIDIYAEITGFTYK